MARPLGNPDLSSLQIISALPLLVVWQAMDEAHVGARRLTANSRGDGCAQSGIECC